MEIVAFTRRVRSRLIKHRGKFREIAEMAGVSHSWLSKFASGKFENPGVNTIDSLARALDHLERAA